MIVDKFSWDDNGCEEDSVYVFFSEFEWGLFQFDFVDEDEAVDVGGEWAPHEVEDPWMKKICTHEVMWERNRGFIF